MAVVLKQDHAPELPEELVKPLIVGSHPQSFDLVSEGWGQKICISIKLPGDADAVAWKSYF